MMAESQLPVLLLLNLVAGLLSVSGTSIISKYVCPGDSVQAFENVDFDRCDGNVTLMLNGEKHICIAKWSLHNCTQNARIISTEYKDRVFLDQNGTLTIHKLHHFDQGTYVVVSKKDPLPTVEKVKIHVMVAPSIDCKPHIVRYKEHLFARLKSDLCGHPVVTSYWKGYDGVLDSKLPLLKISPANEARTYEACIKGPALQCAPKSLTPQNYCVSHIIERNTHETMSTSSCSTDVYLPVSIVLVILLIIAIVVIVILILKGRSGKDKETKKKEVEHQPFIVA